MMSRKNYGDKERILMDIVRRCAGFKSHFGDFEIKLGECAKPGDLIVCGTHWRHDFGVSFYVKKLGPSAALLREIGTERLLEMNNESFYVIAGLREENLMDGDRRRFYEKVRSAVSRFVSGHGLNPSYEDREGKTVFSSYCERFHSLDIDEEKGSACVRIRKSHSRYESNYDITIPFTPKASTVAIQRAMVEAGYGRNTWVRVQS